MRLSIMKVRLQNGEVCFLRDSGERVVSEDSVATCSATWFCYPYSAASANSPIINKSVHPIWNGLYCKSVSIKKYGDGALITAQYEGAESWSSTNDQHESTVEVSCTMREEPIESHPISRDGREAQTSPTAEYSTTTANSSAGIPKLRAAK